MAILASTGSARAQTTPTTSPPTSNTMAPAEATPAPAPSQEPAAPVPGAPPAEATAPKSDSAKQGLKEAGLSGNISLGALYANVRTNAASTVVLGVVRVGAPSNDSLGGSPSAKPVVLPLVTMRLKYTFDTGTQIFFGTWSHGDALQFDNFIEGGLGQKLGSAGTISGSYLFGTKVRIWEDPYAVGTPRSETGRFSQGARLSWDGIFGSGLRVQYVFRSVTIDSDTSGASAGLGASDRDLLRREGYVHQADTSYTLTIARAHRITPSFVYRREALDGDAMSAHTVDGKLQYMLRTRTITPVLEATIGRSVHDESNPLFGKKQLDTRYGLAATVSYRTPFGWKPFGYAGWSLMGTVRYVASVSNIGFYSASLFATGGGLVFEL